MAYARDYLLVVDEINQVMPSSGCGEWSLALIGKGRHRNLGLVGCCHRPLGLGKLLLSQTSLFFIGKTNITNDLNYWSGYLPESVVSLLPKLERRFFAHWNDESEALVVVGSGGDLKAPPSLG